ncbi:MAG: alpha/beta fold hydrolase [Flavobacteriaceae bacterium]
MYTITAFIRYGCLWSSLLLLLTSSLQGQDYPKQYPLPSLKDWFLSTGNWQTSPQIYVREFGKGKDTILMLHGGWGAEHTGMISAVKSLEDEYKFIFYDQRGSLRSPFPDSLITFNSHIEDIELLRKALPLNKLRIIGHSMGAVLASAYAAKYPDRVRQLILLAPAQLKNPIPEEDSELQQIAFQKFQEFMKRPEVALEKEKYGLSKAESNLSSKEQTALFRINFAQRMLYNVDRWVELMGGRALYKGHVFGLTANTYPQDGWDYINRFSKGNYPVSIIAGDHDFLDFDNLLVKKWIKEIPSIELSIINKAGHIIWVDQPDIFDQTLRRALNRK